MEKHSGKVIRFPGQSTSDPLSEILREGARKMLASAIDAEVQVYVSERAHLTDAEGRRAWSATATCPSGRS